MYRPLSVGMAADRAAARYIAVEGPIGVGKTALARHLATELGSQLLLERVDDNPFLRRFYEGDGYGLQTQLFFTLDRYRQQRELFRHGIPAGGVVADYVFAKDGIFAGVALDPDELELYRELFPFLGGQIPKPDLVVYLEARPDVLLRRIHKRDRDYERNISPEYLERLTEAFRSFFYDYTDTPLLVVQCSDVDFVEHGDSLADLIREIRGMRQGVQHYIPLGSR